MSTLWINGVIYLEAFIDCYLYSKPLASFGAAFCLLQIIRATSNKQDILVALVL